MTSMASEVASSSSSVSNNSFTYQVFLSFRGEDTRYTITDTLYNTLCEKGINTFIDANLPKGEKISVELVKAIKESKVSIIVFSENYASSRWCLDELVEILHCKTSNQQEVRAIFYKVDPSHVRHQKGKFGNAFGKLDQVGKYKESMAKWRKALSDAANLSGWHFSDGQSEYKFVHEIVEEISDKVWIPSYDLEVAKYPVGIDFCRQHVEELLHMEKDNLNVGMVGIWGPGGVGKSTIAKAVFNSIKHNFEASCFLADVRSNSIPHGGLANLQQTLLSNIGISSIRTRRQQRKKVLLVLDDVSHLEQLENLPPSYNCFSTGSRIIITTRDKRVLTVHGIDSIYEVKMLDDVQASELFSWNAFKCDRPPKGYRRLTKRAVNYAGGLPLGLVVLGSHLFCRSKDEWEATLDSCKGDHRSEIKNVLRISYNALGEDLKEYFLDIACFFKGGVVHEVKPILEACYDLKPVMALAQLQEKALIRIYRHEYANQITELIWMHDLIEEMGKDMGKSNRLWNLEDIDRALRENTGTKQIKGIQVPPHLQRDSKMMSLNAKSFSKMKNLKFLSMGEMISYGIGGMDYRCSSMVIDFLSNELRWLDWPGCPLRSFPNSFSPNKLVLIRISYSKITRLWDGVKILPALKYIYLYECTSLVELPEFTGTPNLEFLKLNLCKDLVEIHHSLGALHKLKELNLDDCDNVTALPGSIHKLKYLEKLSLFRCSNFITFPVIDTKMDSLRELDLSCCCIEELDESIGNLTGLKKLSLSACTELTTLPCSIFGLQNLQSLTLESCSRLTTFPTNIQNLLNHNGGATLLLPRLKKLDIGRCNLSDCEFLGTLDCWDTLTNLDLSRNNIVSLPVCIAKFLKLEKLDLSGCRRLKEIPELPPKLVRVDASDCDSLERFWNLSEVLGGETNWINLWNCGKLSLNMVNIQVNFPFFIVLPGTITAVDETGLDFWKADIDGETKWKCSIAISKNLEWENLWLAVYAIFEEGTIVDCSKTVCINEVRISANHRWSSSSESSSCHVALEYIPLPVEMQAEVDDQKGYSMLPHYECVVQFESFVYEKCQPLKSIGVYLVCKGKQR